MSRPASASSIVPVLAAGVILNVFGWVTSADRDTTKPAPLPAKVANVGAASPAHAGPASR
jgi:hypothetical protein